MRKPIILLVLTFLLRTGLGLFFVITALLKIGHLDETAEFLTRSRIFPESMSLPLASIGTAMEAAVGVCLLLRRCYRGASVWCSIMTGTFLALYAQAWARGLDLTCNCLGSAHRIVNYPMDTGLRALLFAAACLLIWDSFLQEPIKRRERTLDFSEV